MPITWYGCKCLENKTQSSKSNIIKAMCHHVHMYTWKSEPACAVSYVCGLCLGATWATENLKILELVFKNLTSHVAFPSVGYFVLTLRYSDSSEEHQLKYSNKSCLLHLLKRNTDILICPNEKKKRHSLDASGITPEAVNKKVWVFNLPWYGGQRLSSSLQ